MTCQWSYCIKYQSFLSTCEVYLEVLLIFKWRATYYGSLRAKLMLATLGMPKWVWPSTNQYRILFVQTSTLPPRTHETKNLPKCCMQNNEFQIKSHSELEDNSSEAIYFINFHIQLPYQIHQLITQLHKTNIAPLTWSIHITHRFNIHHKLLEANLSCRNTNKMLQ